MRKKGYFPRIGQIIQALHPNLLLSVWIASILLVIYASLKPEIQLPLNFWNADKMYHMIAYGWLAFLSLWVFRQRKTAIVVMFSLIFLGGALEYAQSFVPGRDCSIWDEAANTLGVILGIVLSDWL